MTEIDKEEFDELMMKEDEEFILMFHADWAAPSVELFKELMGYDEKTLYVIDVQEHPEAALICGVRGVPTLVHVKNGDIMKSQTGYVAGESINELLRIPEE